MADAVIKYARQHGKLIATIIGAVFAVGGMFATARADMEHIKNTEKEHGKNFLLCRSNKQVRQQLKTDGYGIILLGLITLIRW